MRLDGRDVSYMDGGKPTGAILSDYSKDKLKDVDTLFLEYDDKLSDLTLYQEVINDAKMMGIEVVMSRLLFQNIKESPDCWPQETPLAITENMSRLYEIHIPVITIFSQGVNTDQFAVELGLRKCFTEAGYKVSQIGSREISQFFNFPSIPDFMYEHRSAYEKVLRFNQYVRELTENEKSELLIIGVPGAVMKFNDRILEGLGLLPFLVSNAVKSDLSIMCMYYSVHDKNFFEEMSRYGQYRLDAPIDFFSMSNTTLVPDAVVEGAKLKYIRLDSEFVLQGIQNVMEGGVYKLFNSLDDNSVQNACIAVQETLSNNIRYMR